MTTRLISFQDDAGRLIVHGEFFEHDNAASVQLCFKKAIAKFGKPVRLFPDNGGSCANEQPELICAEPGTGLIHTKPCHPVSHGKIERSHRSMKDGRMNAGDRRQWHSLEEVNASYGTFPEKDYTNAVHSSPGMSPKERFMKDFSRIRFVEKEEPDRAFLNRTTGKVSATATVSVFNREYGVPQQYIGRRGPELRYDPSDTSVLYVYENGKSVAKAEPVRKTDNAKRRRTHIRYDMMDGGEKKNV